MSKGNGNGPGEYIYVVRVEMVQADGEDAAVCEGELKVPDTEDIIDLDDLLEAVKVHDLWSDDWDKDEIENTH